MTRNPFGQWLRQWRKARRLTQSELAAEIGFTDAYISAIERNATEKAKGEPIRPSEEFVEKAATALRRPLEEARVLAGYNPSPVPVTLREVESMKIEKWQNGELVPVEVTTDKAKQLLELREQARKLMEQIEKLTV